MKSFVWATDVHLDFFRSPVAAKVFAESLVDPESSGVFLTGDISIAPFLVDHLKSLDDVIGKPIYFVLGNHDLWEGDHEQVTDSLKKLCESRPNLRYMSSSDHISLSDRTAVVGHDGWYDALHGDPYTSSFFMNDWFKVRDFITAAGHRGIRNYSRPNIGLAVAISRQFAQRAADHVERTATEAAKNHDHVVILTHVPPFENAHMHEGRVGSPEAMPWYTSKLMGDAVSRVAEQNPGVRFDVFCGHTHTMCDVQISNNLFCHVGHSEYGNPTSQGTIQVP